MCLSARSSAGRQLTSEQGPTCPHCDASLYVGGPGDGVPRPLCPSCRRATSVCGGFRVGREIGRGGVASIREAAHADGRPAAIKVLDRSTLNSWRVHQLFARSARVSAAFQHEGLPRIVGFERSSAGRSFLAMELLRGGTLRDRVVAGERLTGGAFDDLLRRLLSTVAYLHERSFLHGDVTPRNVMFRGEGHALPVLVDLDGLSSPHERGLPNLVMTPGYTAPEQKAGELTAVADLYAVGATMVYAATGKSPDELPRRGGKLSLAFDVEGIPPRVRDLVIRLCELDPRRRPRSASAALRALSLGTALGSHERAWRLRAVGRFVSLAAAALLLAWITRASLDASSLPSPSGSPALLQGPEH